MRRKKTIIIAIIIAIVIVAVGIVGILYTKTDLFKSDEQLFYKYLFNTKIFDKEISTRYKKAVNNIKTSSYSSSGNVGCSMSSNDNSTNIANIQNIFKVKYNILENKKTKQAYSDFTISQDDKNIATLRYLKENNIYALKEDNVIMKYLALENTNLKEFFSKIGAKDVSKIPDSISQESIEKLLYINVETFNNIKKVYGNIIKDNLKSNNFNKITNSNKTITIELSLTELEIAELEKSILETLKNDEETLNLIINKAEILGYSLNIDSLRTRIQERLDEITTTTYSSERILKVAITENEKNTIKLDLNMALEMQTSDEQKQKKEISASIDVSESNKIILNTSYGDKINLKEDVSFGYEENTIAINIDIFDLNNSEEKNIGKVQYQINNYESDNITQNLLITLLSDENAKVQFDANSETKLKEDIQIEKITNLNSIKLNNMSSEDLNKLLYAINSRLKYLYGDKISIIK